MASLKADPVGWYEANGLTVPPWLVAAEERTDRPDALREKAERAFRDAQASFLWAHLLNVALGAWLVASLPTLGTGGWMMWSDIVSGLLVMAGGVFCLLWRFAPPR